MGVVLYIMLSGKVPFPGECNKEIIENVIKGEYHFQHDSFKSVSDEAKDMISKLLVKDPTKRFSAEQAYNHPWIQMSEPDASTVGSEVINNLNDFVHALKLKKTTLTYLASKLPESSYEDIRKAFIAFDKNGDGRISSDEFKTLLEK